MTLELLRAILGWSAIINMGILLGWFLLILFAHDWLFQLHSKFYKLSEEHFDTLHYAGILFYKIMIWLLFLAPYLALRIIT